jgi:acetate kinase
VDRSCAHGLQCGDGSVGVFDTAFYQWRHETAPSNDPSARRAVDLYCSKAPKYVGAYLAVLGAADAILIGGGVGEHASAVREGILAGLQGLGIVLDPEANRIAIGAEAMISQKNSKTEIWVLPVDEAGLLAEEAVRLALPPA